MAVSRYGVDDAPVFVIDQSRCIGCEACVQACMECGTHRGRSLIHLDRIDRAATTQTAPMVCMHCEDPTCAQVCPADAIKQTEGGIVQSALKPRNTSTSMRSPAIAASLSPSAKRRIRSITRI